MANIPQTQNFYGTDGTAVAVPPPPPPQQRRGSPPARRAAEPASDPNMLQTDVPADPLSPVTLILNYLKSRGYQPSAENIRRTVEANARDPGVLGADPVAGLRNARASTEAEDQAAMRAAGGRGGGGGDGGLVREEGSWDVPGGKTSSAPPATPSTWRGPFSGPPDPTNTLTTTADQAMRFAVPNIPGPEYGLTSDYTRPPLRGPWGGGGGGGPSPTEPPPTGPVGDAVTRALEGPPEQLRLPGPPEVPRLPPPSALPNPGVPVPEVAPAPMAAPMPGVPNVVGQSARPPSIAPGNRIQGAPIIASPLQKAIPKIGLGILSRNPGMVAGSVASAAPEVMDIAKQILGR